MTTSRRRFLQAAGMLLSGKHLTAAATLPGLPMRTGDRVPTAFFTGGAFPGKPVPSLARFLLSLVKAPSPRVCWIGAAGGDDESDYQSFKSALITSGATVQHFNIFRPANDHFNSYFKGFDIVYVDGGSTRNLIALLREWGIDKALREAWLSGVVMSGASAGALCWFDAGLSDSDPNVLSPVRCLGFFNGSCDVHHHSRPDRAPRFRELIASGMLPSPGLALDEEVGALYRGTQLAGLVSGDRAAGAWKIERKGQSTIESQLPVRYLDGDLFQVK